MFLIFFVFNLWICISHTETVFFFQLPISHGWDPLTADKHQTIGVQPAAIKPPGEPEPSAQKETQSVSSLGNKAEEASISAK